MVMKKRRLLQKSQTKWKMLTPKTREARRKRLLHQRRTKPNQNKKRYNRDYYSKNKTEILKRAKERRERFSVGDKRVTRRKSSKF